MPLTAAAESGTIASVAPMATIVPVIIVPIVIAAAAIVPIVIISAAIVPVIVVSTTVVAVLVAALENILDRSPAGAPLDAIAATTSALNVNIGASPAISCLASAVPAVSNNDLTVRPTSILRCRGTCDCDSQNCGKRNYTCVLHTSTVK